MKRRRLGIDSKLYYNSAWDSTTETGYDSPSWVEIGTVEDLTLGTGWNTATGGDRRQGYEGGAKTRAKAPITGRVRVDDTDDGFQALLAAYLAREETLDLMCLNGAADDNGAVGVRGLYMVTDFTEDQGAEQVLYRNMTAVPALGVNPDTPFKSVVVESGVPVFATAFAPPG